MNEKQKDLFEKLKVIRLEKKLTLKQISQSTRIHLKYLESLEQGDLVKIPEIYDKLFFKSYLKSLEVTESEYYDQFIEYRKTIREDRTAILDMTQTDSQVVNEFNYKNLFYFVPIIIAILIIWFLISYTLMVEEDKTDAVQEVSILEVAEKMQSKIDSAKFAKNVALKDTIQSDKSTSLNLNIIALKRTWFRIVIDKKDTSEYMLQKGQNVSFTSEKSFNFLIGKANGLKMIFQDSTYGPFGKEGQIVKSMKFDATGISEMVLDYPLIKTESVDEGY